MPSHQQPPRKRRRFSTSSDDTNASSQTTQQGATPSTTPTPNVTYSTPNTSDSIDTTKEIIVTTTSIEQSNESMFTPPHMETCLPYRTSNEHTYTHVHAAEPPDVNTATNIDHPTAPSTTTPSITTNDSYRTITFNPSTTLAHRLAQKTTPTFTPPCLPHLTSPYPPPVATNPATATLDKKAEYNMNYLEWKGLDEQWRREHLLELASFMTTWRQTMINMVYICYEGQYWALREAGVLMGLIRPESARSRSRRILEGLRRTAEVERMEGERRRRRELEVEMERIGGLMEKWRREREE